MRLFGVSVVGLCSQVFSLDFPGQNPQSFNIGVANFIQQRSGRGRAGGLMGFLNPIGPPRRGQRTQLSVLRPITSSSKFAYEGKYQSDAGQVISVTKNPDTTFSIAYEDKFGKFLNSDSGYLNEDRSLQLTFGSRGIREEGRIKFDDGSLWTKVGERDSIETEAEATPEDNLFDNDKVSDVRGFKQDSATPTSTTTTPEPTTTPAPLSCDQQDDPEACCKLNENSVNHRFWRNRVTVTRKSNDAFLMRIKFQGASETKNYSPLVSFGKKDCGDDFINKLIDGTIKVAITDKAASYALAFQGTGQQGKHRNVVFQFSHNPCTDVNCIGSGTLDQADMIVMGTAGVDMGDIDLETGCLARAKVGYLGAAKKPVRSNKDKTMCIAWVNKFW